ncbi:MAG: RHS repeat protein, partial [Nitrospirae bacterium]|nr:RHS repeat protein [Fimbriimonadaceae bacterium]
ADPVVSRTETEYDGQPLGTVTKGNPTLVREWTDINANTSIASVRTKYDSFGNPVMLLDPLSTDPPVPANGHYREIAFDARFHAYPVSETVRVGGGKPSLILSVAYDLGQATLISSTDFNGHQTTYGYDTFGRLTRVIRPGDSEAAPSIEYDYALAQPFGQGGVINFVEVRLRDGLPGTPGDTKPNFYRTRSFVDGLGRELMTKEEAERDPDTGAPRVAVSGAVTFNARGQAHSALNPYYSLAGSDLDALLAFEDVTADDWQGVFHENGQLVQRDLATAHKSVMTYDETLRTLVATNPDGTERKTVYEPLVVRSFDENDADPASQYADTPMVHHSDGLERLIQVDEVVRLNADGTPSASLNVWTTRYAYRADG